MTAHWTRPRPVRVRTTAGHLELEATSIQSATATALELHPGAQSALGKASANVGEIMTCSMKKLMLGLQSCLDCLKNAFYPSCSPRQASRLGPTIGRKRRKRRQRHLFKSKQFPTNHV